MPSALNQVKEPQLSASAVTALRLKQRVAERKVTSTQKKAMKPVALPLIAIEAPVDPTPVADLWRHLARQRLLMFVSPAAVDWFFRLRPPDAPWPATPLMRVPVSSTSNDRGPGGNASTAPKAAAINAAAFMARGNR